MLTVVNYWKSSSYDNFNSKPGQQRTNAYYIYMYLK